MALEFNYYSEKTKTAISLFLEKRSFLVLFWNTAILFPTLLTFYANKDLTLSLPYIFFISTAQLFIIRFFIPEKAYFAITLPLLLFGFARWYILNSRGADLFDLYIQLGSFSPIETKGEFSQYYTPLFCAIFFSTLFCVTCSIFSKSGKRTRLRTLQSIFVLVLFIKLVPLNALAASWPSDFILASTGLVMGDKFLWWHLFPNHASNDVRQAGATWKTKNTSSYKGGKQTIILVIGETIRNDFMNECNGPKKIRRVSEGALVACDVTSGADSTAYSVPLLISRELPGHKSRISSDSTFESALGEVGFESYWIGAQFAKIAYPDAKHKIFNIDGDRDLQLLPHFSSAISALHNRKVIVLHAYNAHAPYCIRYDKSQAPYQTQCADLSYHYTKNNLNNFIPEYANAVDASVAFLNTVIEIANSTPGEVFLVFAPDHGENFFDDDRSIYGHELTHPTRWDSHVPLVFWANHAWKNSHESEWENLRQQIHRPLMHADVIPTIMAAAGVSYDDPRRGTAIDLLHNHVPERNRIVQSIPGNTITWQAMVAEAQKNHRQVPEDIAPFSSLEIP